MAFALAQSLLGSESTVWLATATGPARPNAGTKATTSQPSIVRKPGRDVLDRPAYGSSLRFISWGTIKGSPRHGRVEAPLKPLALRFPLITNRRRRRPKTA